MSSINEYHERRNDASYARIHVLDRTTSHPQIDRHQRHIQAHLSLSLRYATGFNHPRASLALLADEVDEVSRPAAGTKVPHAEAVPHAPNREGSLPNSDHEVSLLHHQRATLGRERDRQTERQRQRQREVRQKRECLHVNTYVRLIHGMA